MKWSRSVSMRCCMRRFLPAGPNRPSTSAVPISPRAATKTATPTTASAAVKGLPASVSRSEPENPSVVSVITVM
ncbi:hypothetical protein GCM10017687_67970 [Streptomyces echinatus]|uniref:Uncharacterized protein n=1 Tax=Streptomyces echinatus TaxID=67293 RepID=A0A7W9Q223_9ACTN|nr:hypothetical protein [Streptomyces echinatus]